ncbi:Nickel uptake substrate-specific transmembrane region, partial [Haemophilus influenzae]
MKKTLITSLLVLSGIAQAHEVWVQAPTKLASGSVLKAELAYGDYPYVEKIPEARLKIFAPMEIIHQNGEKQTLIQKGENYQYQSENALSDGSYWITATYKPTFW